MPVDITTASDDELLARNRDLGSQREAILEEQFAITAELDRRYAERETDRIAVPRC